MWIELHDNLPDHPKVIELATVLKMDKDAVVGKLIRLWLWALLNRESGTFTHKDVSTIAEIMRFRGKPQRLVDSLVAARLLDYDGTVYMIHDWEERVCMLLEQREKTRLQTRARVQKFRDKKRACNALHVTQESNAGNALHVTQVTPKSNACNAATVPNHIYIDSMNQSINHKSVTSDGLTERIRDRMKYQYYVDFPDSPDAERIKELINVMVSVYAAGADAKYRINGADINGAQVIPVYDQLETWHLRYVLEKLDELAPDVQNMRAYAIACLYNAPLQSCLDVRAAVNNDLKTRAGL